MVTSEQRLGILGIEYMYTVHIYKSIYLFGPDWGSTDFGGPERRHTLPTLRAGSDPTSGFIQMILNS
jgi:hypothetical protein